MVAAPANSCDEFAACYFWEPFFIAYNIYIYTHTIFIYIQDIQIDIYTYIYIYINIYIYISADPCLALA